MQPPSERPVRGDTAEDLSRCELRLGRGDQTLGLDSETVKSTGDNKKHETLIRPEHHHQTCTKIMD